ncbi:MAG: cobalamin-binding protein [Planctomycetota bacterium]|nr:MAG: cobalamin-binding protein [Planctomycetota bacterium]
MPAPLDRLLGGAPRHPSRIVCLTEEPTETLYRLGAGDRVVGVSGYTVRPKEARAKPKVSAFIEADVDAILALRPDLVVGFSDLQADIAATLVRRGAAVLLFNQRSVAEILQMVHVLAGVVGLAPAGERLAGELEANLRRHAQAAQALPRRPRVFFEEWHAPLIAGIRWCSELIEIAGGEDVCAEKRACGLAKDRIVDPAEIARRDPEVVIASWCGRKVLEARIRARPGWSAVAAVRADQLYEIKSTYILQPGPAALSDGLDQLAAIVHAAAGGEHLPRPRPGLPRQAPMAPRYA